MTHAEWWLETQETLVMMAGILRTDSSGQPVARLPPPISPDIDERCDEWLREWVPKPDGHRPGGELQGAAYARVWSAVIFAEHALRTGNVPPIKGDIADGLVGLLLKGRPVLSQIWSEQWKQA